MASAQTVEKRAIPAHVPPELVLPIGLVEGPEFLAAPHEFMARLHDTHPPVFFSPSERNGDAWMLTKHEDVYFVLRHPEIFTTQGSTPFPRDPNNYFRMLPIEVDPPEHRKFRAVLDNMFALRAVVRLEATIRNLANNLIDRFMDRRECEFTTEFGRPLPVSVFLDLMGLPQEMRDTFVRWAMGLLHSQDRKIAEIAMKETVSYLRTAIKEKTDAPDGGLLSAIVHGKRDDAPLTAQEIFGF